MLKLSAALGVSLAAALSVSSPARAADAGEPAFRALYKELVETNTTASVGSCTLAAERVAARMKAAGFTDAELTLFTADGFPKDGGLVAVLPGKDPKAKAVLLLAHIDVVEAKREDWTRDPFTLVEEGGYFYGRGASDDKAQAAIWADLLIRYRQEGYKPRRTVKMALTCGEESGGRLNGASWLSKNRRELIDAEFALNEGALGELDEAGKPVAHTILAAEKSHYGITLEVTNPGGHSSLPVPENAIYRLVKALDRVAAFEFPVRFVDANRAYFTRMAKVKGGEVGQAMAAIVADPTDAKADALLSRSASYHSMLRTTCVATMVEAGHAVNALPQRARASLSCRVLPGETAAQVRDTLIKVIADPQVTVTAPADTGVRPPTAAMPAYVVEPVEKVTAQIWPGVPVVPIMKAWATDARHLTAVGIPTYGISGLFVDPDEGRAHGLNERIRVKSLMDGREFSYRLLKLYADRKD